MSEPTEDQARAEKANSLLSRLIEALEETEQRMEYDDGARIGDRNRRLIRETRAHLKEQGK